MRLYEAGASKKRIALYLALWLGWAMSCDALATVTVCRFKFDPPRSLNQARDCYLVLNSSTSQACRDTGGTIGDSYHKDICSFVHGEDASYSRRIVEGLGSFAVKTCKGKVVCSLE